MYRNLITSFFTKDTYFTLDKEIKLPGQGHLFCILVSGGFSVPEVVSTGPKLTVSTDLGTSKRTKKHLDESTEEARGTLKSPFIVNLYEIGLKAPRCPSSK